MVAQNMILILILAPPPPTYTVWPSAKKILALRKPWFLEYIETVVGLFLFFSANKSYITIAVIITVTQFSHLNFVCNVKIILVTLSWFHSAAALNNNFEKCMVHNPGHTN